MRYQVTTYEHVLLQRSYEIYTENPETEQQIKQRICNGDAPRPFDEAELQLKRLEIVKICPISICQTKNERL